MSFTDRPTYGSWKQVGCFLLGFVVAVADALVLMTWFLSFWDPSTDTYRSAGLLDLVFPALLLASALPLWLYVRLVMRDKR